MHLRMDGQPFLLQLAVWACAAVFAASFVSALCVNLLALSRTGALMSKADERELSWGG